MSEVTKVMEGELTTVDIRCLEDEEFKYHTFTLREGRLLMDDIQKAFNLDMIVMYRGREPPLVLSRDRKDPSVSLRKPPASKFDIMGSKGLFPNYRDALVATCVLRNLHQDGVLKVEDYETEARNLEEEGFYIPHNVIKTTERS